MDKAVFLDFDGVLFDTVREAYLACLFAMEKIKRAEEVNYDSGDFKIFEKYRYLIGPAWNYFYLLKIIGESKEQNSINFRNKFLEYIDNADLQDYKEFERKFFTARAYLQKKHENFWLKLNKPYNFLYKLDIFFKRYPNKFFIITTKDIATVIKLFKINSQSFNKENIYDKDKFEKFKTKSNIIKDIMKNKLIKNAIFIDDSRFHLSNCGELSGLKLIQPQWGYVSPDDNVSNEDETLFRIKELLEVV